MARQARCVPWVRCGWVTRGTVTQRQRQSLCAWGNISSKRGGTQRDVQRGSCFSGELATPLLPTPVLSEVLGRGVLSCKRPTPR